MGHLSGTLELDAAPEVVWAFLRDARLRPQWEVGVVAVEDVSGPLDELGATWTEVRRFNGVTMRQHFTVSRVEPSKLLEFTGTSAGGGRTVIRESVAPTAGGGTIKAFEVDYTLPGGPVGAVLDRFYMHRKLESAGELEDQKTRELVAAHGGSVP